MRDRRGCRASQRNFRFDPEERRHLMEHVIGLGRSAGTPRTLDSFTTPRPPPLFAVEACAAFDLAETSRNPHFVFLREIGGPECLVDYLNAPYPWSRERIVVIDQLCEIDRELLIPAGVTLRGCGIYGIGRIDILGDATGIASGVIKFGAQGHASFMRPAAIEDLHINCKSAAGAAIGIRGLHKRVSRVRITGFSTGITSQFDAHDVLLDTIVIGGLAFTEIGVDQHGTRWRIRQPFIRDTLGWGIDVNGSDVVIESGRFENNGNKALLEGWLRGAIRVRGANVRIIANYLEQNGWLEDENHNLISLGTAVSVEAQAQRVAIFANFLAADGFLFDGRYIQRPLPPPNENTLFDANEVPQPALTTALYEGRHSLAFNAEDDTGTNFYFHRGLMVASVGTFQNLP